MNEKKNKKLPVFDFGLCVNCGVCEQACPVSRIELSVGGVDVQRNLYPKVKSDGCLGCAICAKSCPVEAIRLEEAA